MAEAEAWAMIPKLDKDKTGCVLDMHPIGLCKNCKHYMTIHCTCDGCCISDDWFCADGERKESWER
jgi:hypothetical protein